MGSGGALKLLQRVWAEPCRQTLSGAFSAYLDAFLQTFSCSVSFVKLLFHVASDVKYHIVVISKFGYGHLERRNNRLIIFLHKIFCGSVLGAPRSSGSRFIEPPEPPVSTPLLLSWVWGEAQAEIEYRPTC